RAGYMRSSTQTISAPAGVRPVDHGRRNSSLLRTADGSFSTGRRLVRCPPLIFETPRLAAHILCRVTRIIVFNETHPLDSAHLRCSPAPLWSLAVLFILALHSCASSWRCGSGEFACRFFRYSSIAKEAT